MWAEPDVPRGVLLWQELAVWAQSGNSVQDPQYITLQQELAVVLQRVEQIDGIALYICLFTDFAERPALGSV